MNWYSLAPAAAFLSFSFTIRSPSDKCTIDGAGKRTQAAAESLSRIRIQDIDLSLIVDSRQQKYCAHVCIRHPMRAGYQINILVTLLKLNLLLILKVCSVVFRSTIYHILLLLLEDGNHRTCTKFQPRDLELFIKLSCWNLLITTFR
jgi:hypothetical protein